MADLFSRCEMENLAEEIRTIPKKKSSDFGTNSMGEKMAPMTKPVSFADGVLTVKVKSSTLYSLLVAHEKPRLLGRLKEKFSIRNLVFRVG